jgi:arabinofuranan 3-O-arabinosyltransferase
LTNQQSANQQSTPDRAVRWAPALFALIAYVPLLLTRPGRVGADTKQYLYLDPATLLHRAVSMWDPNVGMGTVTHENIGYLWPMGPFYRLAAAVGMPMWVAQRLWLGSLLLLAGLGVRYLLRVLGWRSWPLVVASLAYMLTPYVMQYEARISAILIAWAGLPWMLGLAIMALRRGGWRYPALFALVAATCGSVNATSLIYAGLAPVLWIVFAVFVHRDTPWRHGLVTALRIGGLTLLASAWWIAGLATQAGYGLNVLRYTETVEVVARTGLPYEALRGLGNWFFYGRDAVNAWVQPAAQYTQDWWLLAISFAVPLLAFGGAVIARWRDRVFFVALVLVGVALAVGVHPYEHPAPLGAAFKAIATSSTAGLALRSTGRAVPLVVLGTAVLLAAGLETLRRRWTKLATVAGGLVVVLVAIDMFPLFAGEFVDANLNRPEAIPTYWRQAAAWLDAQGHATRVLELPGADFSHYRWGATLDPVTPGLMNRPFVGRELQPYGSPASTDLLIALDRRMQEGVLETSALAPVARLMGVGDVVLRSDLQYERFRSPRPKPTWQLFSAAAAGLAAPMTFGPPYPSGPTVIPLIDETTLATPPDAPDPPAVAAFPVDDSLPIVRAALAERPLVIAGSGEGVVDAAAAGLLPRGQPVLYAAALDVAPGGWTGALAAGADLVLTDSNRRRAMRWGTIRENSGYTEQAGEQPLVPDPTDARLPLFPGTGDAAMTVAQLRGIAGVRASHYGNPVSYAPGDRPALALDGDPLTAWKVGAFNGVKGERLRIDLAGDVTTDRVRVVQPQAGPADRFITRTTLHFDRGLDVTVDLGPDSRRPTGQLLTFPSRTFTRLELVIDADNVGQRADYRGTSGVGFAEVSIGDGTLPGGAVRADEVIRLPVDLLGAVGNADTAHRLIVLLDRQRSDPLESFKTDEEQSVVRTFDLPSARTFSITGAARVSAYADNDVVDTLLGRPPVAVGVTASSRLPGDLAARPQSALDGNPATAWQSAFGDPVGQWIEVNAAAPFTVDSLALTLLADGQHSVPTKVRLVPDHGAAVTVDVPASGPLRFPAMTTTKLRVEIVAARRVTTINYFSKTPAPLPIGISEIGIPGVTLPATSARFDSGCRADLLTVDGTPVPLRAQGSTADAGQRLGLAYALCGPPLRLGPGPHVVRAAPGRLTGLDLDRIVLGSERGGGPLVPPASTPRLMPPVQVVKQGRSWMDVRVDAPGAPFWLVLGQSLNKGWTATAAGVGDLGEPQLVDGYANGWLVTPKAAGPMTVHLRWTPQSRVDVGLWLSALAAVLCVALAVIDPRRRRALRERPATDTGPSREVAVGSGSPRKTIGLGVGIAVGAVVLAGAWGIVAGVLAAVVLARPRLRWVLTGGALASFGAAALYVVQLEVRYRFPVKLEWPQHFEKVAGLAWLGVLLLAADAVIGYARRRADEASSASA